MAKTTRRTFLKTAAAASLFTIVPRRVLGGPGHTPPSEQLRIAGIGAGGQAMHDLGQVSMKGDPIVALADVDDARAGKAWERWPDAKRYRDFREMLDKEGDNIDAVVVACPDHVHAVAATACMQAGKHVYVEKPMAHEIAEVRALMKLAKETGVVTQMGNQGHSFPSVYRLKYWMDDGVIGEVTDVHCHTNRPSWPQGIDRPADSPPVPDTLDWDLWLGPAAARPYNPAYCPRNWRGWQDFGTGALGDMGCHIFDAPFYALDLGAPTRITPDTTPVNGETYPSSSKLTYEFPARGEGFPAVKLHWYDGENKLERPEELPDGKPLGDNDGGTLFVGTKGKALCGTYSNGPKLLPFERMDDYEHAKVKVRRSSGHHREWVEACKANDPEACASNFDYAGPLTEVVLLGNIAIRTGEAIEWDAKARKITNNEAANALLAREYREGWGNAPA